jgi:hypothetical protein
VHVNGIVERRPARHARVDRAAQHVEVDRPGMLDNMIGGGVPRPHGVAETLSRKRGRKRGSMRRRSAASRRAALRIPARSARGTAVGVIIVHDLGLPPSVVPRNQDGEVGEFMLLSATASIDRPAEGRRMTADASLVTLDWLDATWLLDCRNRAGAPIFGEWARRLTHHSAPHMTARPANTLVRDLCAVLARHRLAAPVLHDAALYDLELELFWHAAGCSPATAARSRSRANGSSTRSAPTRRSSCARRTERWPRITTCAGTAAR